MVKTQFIAAVVKFMKMQIEYCNIFPYCMNTVNGERWVICTMYALTRDLVGWW